jgi:hypothetical protein
VKNEAFEGVVVSYYRYSIILIDKDNHTFGTIVNIGNNKN